MLQLLFLLFCTDSPGGRCELNNRVLLPLCCSACPDMHCIAAGTAAHNSYHTHSLLLSHALKFHPKFRSFSALLNTLSCLSLACCLLLSSQIQVMTHLRTLLSALLLVLSVSEPLNSPEENEVLKHTEEELAKSQASDQENPPHLEMKVFCFPGWKCPCWM